MTRPRCIVVCIVVLHSCSCCCRCCIVVLFFPVVVLVLVVAILLSVVCSHRLLLCRLFIVRRHPLVTVLPFLWLSRCIVVVSCCFVLFCIVVVVVVSHCCWCCSCPCGCCVAFNLLSTTLVCSIPTDEGGGPVVKRATKERKPTKIRKKLHTSPIEENKGEEKNPTPHSTCQQMSPRQSAGCFRMLRREESN